jgi:Chorismate synthase
MAGLLFHDLEPLGMSRSPNCACHAGVQGFEIGSGFSGAAMLGSEHNDEFFMEDGRVRTRTNRSGGIQASERGQGLNCCTEVCIRGASGLWRHPALLSAGCCLHVRVDV